MDDVLAEALRTSAPIAHQKVGATSRAAGGSSAAASEASSDWFAPLPSLHGARKRAASASSVAASSAKQRRT
eukprot:8539423-Alexandrium_andersonii.AAC.1